MVLSSADAFMSPSSLTPLTSSSNSCHRSSLTTTTTQTPIATPKSTTVLFERQWNFNQGRGPWGLKKNAEIWNGRVAQVAFVVVLLQELITGKGVIASITDGDAVGYAFLGLAGVGTLGLTIWLAIKGDESDIVF